MFSSFSQSLSPSGKESGGGSGAAATTSTVGLASDGLIANPNGVGKLMGGGGKSFLYSSLWGNRNDIWAKPVPTASYCGRVMFFACYRCRMGNIMRQDHI